MDCTLSEPGDKVSCICSCHFGEIAEFVRLAGDNAAEFRLPNGELICLAHSQYEPLGN